ncbi:hypothetical protein CC78DRAFT_293548 [Lojkania enalia]|uniref:Uncharacterized protein n=1 Tax=Lojkania enalia TaxID=147567 RepID=A0A9P4K6H4_9PLEO|nr:hypothetical protein CC78DRAFT_293548 [Didymosphaeria enalia]
MRSSSRTVVMSGLVAIGVSATNSVSLSNFTPRIENLPSECQTVYNRPIQGCTAEDFTSSDRSELCSTDCVVGLVEIAKDVQQACSNVDVPETSIIGVFLLGFGVEALCPDVVITTVTPSPSTTQVQQQTTTKAEARTSSEAASSSTSSTSSSEGIDVDTSVPTAPGTTLATTFTETPTETAAPSDTEQPPPANTDSSSAEPSQTASSQKSNADSGGGSPFDVQATGGSTTLRSLTLGAVTGIFALVCAAI